MKFVTTTTAGALAALLFSGATSAAGYCSLGQATEGITPANVTFNNLAAQDCYGVNSGNITNNNDGVLNDAATSNWGSGWVYLDSTDASSATYMGISFTVTETGTSSGTWVLTGTDTNGATPLNFPFAMDFAVALKGGNEYALWAFDDRMVTSGPNNGTFSIVFTNNGGQIPALSHMTVFGREADGGSVPVPEAETYAMMLAGLGMIGFMMRRRVG